jgi:protein SCO1
MNHVLPESSAVRQHLRLLMIAACIVAAAGCKSAAVGGSDQAAPEAGAGGYDVASKDDCLPKTTLVDQDGNTFSLDSLKGKPVLMDFIYTSCPGPCLMLTAKLANVALRLGPDLGGKVAMVSITIDPEHDNPQALLKYSREQGAQETGWTFLTGSPSEIDHVMNLLKLRREIEPDGSVAHVADMFLIGPDGHELKEYSGSIAKPQDIAADMKKAAAAG